MAASAIGAGVGSAVGGALGNANAFSGLGQFGQGLAIGAVSGFAGGLATAAMRGGKISVTQVAADAFGNALGSSLASASAGTNVQGQGPWSDVDYRNGSDIQSDNFNGMGSGGSDYDQNVARMLDLTNRTGVSGRLVNVGEPDDLVDLSPTNANAMRLGLMGSDGQTEGVWSSPVMRPNVVGVPLLPLGSSVMGPSLPEIELQQRYTGGVTQAVSMGWSETFNSSNSIGERLIYGGLALAGTPNMLIESMLCAPLNAAPAAREMGQYMARAALQADSAERNMDILRAVGTGAEAFSATGAWLTGPRRSAAAGMSASELAVVRATYAQSEYLPGFTASDILSIDKGVRPNPSTYLSPGYIEDHLSAFDSGASRFVSKSNFEKYGIGQADGTSFVIPRTEADALLKASGNSRYLEQALGLPENFLNSNSLVRVSIENPRELNLRIPSDNEAGANSQWLPAGKLP